METGIRQLTSSDLDTFSTTKQDQYGAIGVTSDGRFFRYVGFGGTSTINPGALCVGPAAPTNSTALAITATTATTSPNLTANLQANSRQLNITNGTTAVTTDQFQYLEIIVSAGGLYTLRLDGHTAAGNAGVISCYLYDPLPQGITQLIPGTDTVNLRLSKFNGCLPSTTGNAPVGVAVNAIPNTASVTNYGWVQTSGHAYIPATSTIGIGLGIAQDQSGTAGNVIVAAATTGSIGWSKAAAASGFVSAELNILG